MVKERIASPNLKLQEERHHRAWSQQELADRLGTTHNNVSRWERGLTKPNPYFRQKLREVFALTEAQLGLQGEEREALTTPGSLGIFDPLIPLSLPYGLVGRDDLLNRLKKRLCLSPALAISALNGLPGVGKTALAVAVAHDPEILRHFHDGVLWAGLGTRPDLLALYSRWGSLLAIHGEKLTTLEEWAMALRMAIGSRRMLLLIDDAWRLEQALACKVGGPNCTYLLTTRMQDISVQFATGEVTTVGELDEEESISILKRLAPEVMISDARPLRELARAVGGLPLALALMGNYLRTHAYSGQPRRLYHAIERLRDTQVRLALRAPLAAFDQVSTLPVEEPVSLQAVIALSDQQLNEQARSSLRALSVFPPKPSSFSEEAALAICTQHVEALDQLQDSGLLESNGSGRYTLHQTIVDYAWTRRDDSAAFIEQSFATYMADFAQRQKTAYIALEAESANIVAALNVAFERGLGEQYVRITLNFAHYLCVKGMYSTAEYHVRRALQGACLDAASHSELLNYLGIIAKKYGRLAEAEVYHRQGLLLARQGEQLMLEVEHLCRLGFLLSLRQHYAQASSTFQEALAKARHSEDPMKTCTIINGLAVVLKETASYAAAKGYIQQGLELARRYGLIEREVTLLINWSTIESLQGNAAHAERLAQQALAMAEIHGLNESLTYLNNLLSDLAMDRADYEEALACSARCLSLAHQQGHVELIGASLCTIGTAHGRLGDFERAEAALQEAVRIVPADAFPLLLQEIALQSGEMYLLAGRVAQAQEVFQSLIGAEEVDIRARAFFGMVRVCSAREDWSTALNYARQCLALPEAAVVLIREWFEEHEAQQDK